MIAGPPYLLPAGVEEGDVRQACSPAAFVRADAWQRAGHVQRPVAGHQGLGASVLGTWRRVDQVYVHAPAGRLTSVCTCGQPSLCAHGAALLLQWLRQPESVASGTPRSPVAPNGGPTEAPPTDRLTAWLDAGPLPLDDLATLLSVWTMAELREIARRRGVRSSNKTKVDLVAQLAADLSTPDNIEAALAGLSADELLTLQIVELLGPYLAARPTVAAAFHWFGGRGAEPPLASLTGLVLLGAVVDPTAGINGYAVIGAVAKRLPPLEGLARPAVGEVTDSVEPGLDMLQALLTLVHEAGSRMIAPREQEQITEHYPAPPDFWRLVSVDQASPPQARAHASFGGQARVVPYPPMLTRAERGHLAHEMGRTLDFVTLALHIAMTLGIVTTSDRLVGDLGALLRFLRLSSSQRSRVLLATLGAPQYLVELRRLFAENAPLQLQVRLGYAGRNTPLLGQAAHLRTLLQRALGKLPVGVWFDYRSFVDGLRGWGPWQSPLISFAPPHASAHSFWWITDEQETALDLSTPENWDRVYGRFIDLAFVNSLTGIGLIDITVGPDGPQAFRVRAQGDADPAFRPLRVDPALNVDVSAGASDSAVYDLLLRGGELTEVSPQGLRYRLTAERVRTLFEQGFDSQRLITFLADHSAQPLPEAARATIARWWSSFGQIRLYDTVTLLELADDYLLPELLQTTRLASAIIATLSPRLVAVDSKAVSGLMAEFTRAGHPPGVIDGRG